MFFRQRTTRLPAPIVALCAALALGAFACDKKEPASSDDAKGSTAAPTGEAAPSGAQATTGAENNESNTPTAKGESKSDQLLAYLEPEARAVLITRIGQDFEPAVLGTVMGLPPGAVRLLESRHRVLDGLEAMTGESLEQVSAWLGPDMMVMSPQVAVRDYVVATTSLDAEALGKKLEAAGMQKTELEGQAFWLPSRSFGFKVTFLKPGLLAFIPVQELGSGLGPLQVGQEQGASEMRTQLGAMLREEPNIVMALHAGGPMLHLDLHGDVNASQLGLRRADSGYDAQVVLQPAAPLDEAAKTLAAREHPEESQQVQALMKRVKFIVDREALIGEVHLSDEDFKLLQ